MASAHGGMILRAVIVLAGCQLLFTNAMPTEEDKLRAAITNPAVTSYELNADLRLRKNLPFFALSSSGTVRKFTLFSNKAVRPVLSGSKKYTGFRTPELDIAGPLIDFTVTNVSLIDFRAPQKRIPEEGIYQGYGAAIRIAGSLKISNSVISGNIAFVDGGAIYVSGGSLELTLTTFSRNKGGRQGGAVAHFPDDNKALTVQDTNFFSNIADAKKGKNIFARGGAIHLEALVSKVLVVFRRVVFRGNTAGNGGAIYTFFPPSEERPLLFDTVSFLDNSIQGRLEAFGGAILANYVTNLQFIKPKFVNNIVDNLRKKTRNDVLIFWNLPGNTTVTGVLGSGAVITSNEPGRFKIVS